MATSQTVTQTSIPDWAQDYFTGDKGIFTRAQAQADRKYQPYETADGTPIDRLAGFSGLTQKAMQDAYNMGPSAAGIQGQGIAGAAGLNALNTQYDPTKVDVNQLQIGSFTQPGAASAYMDPYMQNVVDIQKREAQRAADVAGTGRNAQAVKAGAFGGSRQAIMDAEAQRNLAQQMGDIQAKGSSAAYNQAMQQFNAEQQLGLTAQTGNQQAGLDAQKLMEQSRQYGAGLGMEGLRTAITGANQLGALGQQEFMQGMDVNKLMSGYGAQQQAQQQAAMDTQYQDFLTQQQYPYQQIGFMTDVLGTGLRGASGVMGQAQNIYSAPPSTTSQLLGLGTAALGAYGAFGKAGGGTVGYAGGGSIGGYATGGIAGLNPMELDAATNKMSDQQMQGVMGLASVADLAKLQIAQKLAQNNQIRQAAMQAQAAQQPRPQMSIAEEQMMQMGIGNLPVGDDVVSSAGGGIIAFARGGDAGGGDAGNVRERFGMGYSAEADAAYKSEAQARAQARAEQERKNRIAARDVTGTSPSLTGASTGSDYAGLKSLVDKYAGLGDEPMKAAKEATQAAGDAEIRANEEFVAQMRRDQTAMGERGVKEEKAIKASQKDMKGAEDKNLNMALIEAGLAIMSGTSENAFENIGKGASVGLKGYKEGVDKIQLKKDKLQESLNRLNDARFSDKKDNAKEVRAAEKGVMAAKTALGKSLANVQVEGAKLGAANAMAAIDAQVKISTQEISDKNAMARTIAAIPALTKEANELLRQGNRIAGMDPGPEKDAAEKALAERLERLENAARAQYPGGASVEQRAKTAEAKLSADIEDSINKAVALEQMRVKLMPEGPARVEAQKLVDAEKEKLREQYRRAEAGGAGTGSTGKVFDFNDI